MKYTPAEPFPWVIGRTKIEISPAWKSTGSGRSGCPAALTIVLEVNGFGQLGRYGSPIATRKRRLTVGMPFGRARHRHGRIGDSELPKT